MRKLTICLTALALLLPGVFQLASAAPDDPAAPPRPLSPMMIEIQAALQQQETALGVLQTELKTAPTEQDALRVLRAIAQRKQDTEIGILRIQERFAREAGENEAAARIEQAIEKILHPVPVKPSEKAQQEREARRTEGAGHE